MNFKDKVVVVTGAARGIGKGIAEAFLKNGARVALNDVNIDQCNRTAQEIGGPNQVMSFPADVSDSQAVKKMVGNILKTFGAIDILVNNAGVIYVVDCIDTTEEQWDKTMAVNVKSMFLCCREIAPHMIKKKQGRIINLASMLGKTAVAKYSHYCASKFAVIGFTQSLSKELSSYGINVNAVCPGIVDTDMMALELSFLTKMSGKSEKELRDEFLKMIPLGRYEYPDDIGKVVLFLASESASYMTGQAINITGGIEVH